MLHSTPAEACSLYLGLRLDLLSRGSRRACTGAYLILQLCRGAGRASQLQLLCQQVVQRLPGAFLLVVGLQKGTVHLV